MVMHPTLESKFFAAVDEIAALPFVKAAATRDPRDRRGVRGLDGRLDRALHRPHALHDGPIRSSASRRGRRRWCRRRACPSASTQTSILKIEGANPTGSFKDRGMTCAVTAAAREGAETVDLRLDRQHRRQRRRLRRPRRDDLRRARARGQDRRRQARPGADLRRARDLAERQLRRRAAAGPRPRRPAPDLARQLGQRLPPRGPEDRRRSRSSTRSARST